MPFSKRHRFAHAGRTGLLRLAFSRPLAPDGPQGGWRLLTRHATDPLPARADEGAASRWENEGGAAAGARATDGEST